MAAGTALSPAQRLDEIPGVGPATACVLIAELGVDASVWPDAARLTAWAKLVPQTRQSGNKKHDGSTGQGNHWLKAALGEAAASAARTDTHLGAVYRRIARRRGKSKALVAVARHILVIAHHLMQDPHARYTELGADYADNRADKGRRIAHHLNQLRALGVQLQPVA
jgi:transposase